MNPLRSVYAILYPLISAASFAISSVMVRRLGEYATPVQLNLYRTLVGAILFLVHALFSGKIHILLSLTPMIIAALILSVIFNVVLGDTSYFLSQERIGVKIATPIVNLYPLATIVMAFFILDEQFTIQFLVGSLIIITGVILLSSGSDDESTDFNKIGLIFAFVSMILYAAGVLAVTLASTDVDPVIANTVRLPSAAILLTGISLTRSGTRKKPDTRFITMMLIAGILGTYISSYYLVLSSQVLGAGATAVFTSLGPFFALPLAIFWLKEHVTKAIVTGTTLTVFGLIIILI